MRPLWWQSLVALSRQMRACAKSFVPRPSTADHWLGSCAGIRPCHWACRPHLAVSSTRSSRPARHSGSHASAPEVPFAVLGAGSCRPGDPQREPSGRLRSASQPADGPVARDSIAGPRLLIHRKSPSRSVTDPFKEAAARGLGARRRVTDLDYQAWPLAIWSGAANACLTTGSTVYREKGGSPRVSATYGDHCVRW